MPKQPQKTDLDQQAQSKLKMRKLSGIGLIACFVLAMATFVIVMVSIQDFGGFHLQGMLGHYSTYALVVFVLSISAFAFLSSKSSKNGAFLAQSAIDTATAPIDEKISTIDGKIAAIEEKVQTYLGSEYERLKSENENLKNEFEEFEKMEREKTTKEIEELRAKNLELQEQLKKWVKPPEQTSKQPLEQGDEIHAA